MAQASMLTSGRALSPMRATPELASLIRALSSGRTRRNG
jgi:hypothetical protein